MLQNYAHPIVEAAIPRWHYLDMDNMSKIRKARNLTQQQLADMVGANQATISKIEQGNGNPTLDMINRIATALHVETYELFSRNDIEQRVMDALNGMTDPRQKEAAIIVLESMSRR